MSKKKINPRRVPVSLADMKKNANKATDEAIHLAFAIFLTVLKDKFGFSNEDIVKAWYEADKLSEEVLKDGLVKLKDLVDMLRDEYKIDLRK
jgi:dimeric dUTPase (all-alpha-NTP-PPase superfamily)